MTRALGLALAVVCVAVSGTRHAPVDLFIVLTESGRSQGGVLRESQKKTSPSAQTIDTCMA
jgi:hypothetical protein